MSDVAVEVKENAEIVSTGRKEESKILDLVEKEYGTIPVSINTINGIDIIVPS